ncbi:MAG: carbon-nitrogen hydrolase family protein [Rhodospirillales bacterium]
MTERTVTLSILQFNAQDGDKAATVEKCLSMLDSAAARGSQIVVLPEVWTGTGFSSAEAYREIAEPIPGPTVARLQEKAREHALYIVGSLYETCETPGVIYNTAPVIGPSGAILGKYRKTHLFDAGGRKDLPLAVMESEKVTPGDQLQLYDTNLCRFGVGICSDIRFPEIFRAYALAGAELVILPTAFLSPRFDHWDWLVKARAADHQIFLAASGMSGKEAVSGIAFVGRSVVVDPWGVALATAPDEEAVVTTVIDLEQVGRVRAWWPLNDQRRQDLYDRVAVLRGEAG